MRLLQQFILDSIGEYLPGIDKEQLRVDVLNGRCYLENVDCTPGPVFSFDGFPFHLVAGHIGNLELKVPWKSLPSSPVRVCAENVSLRLEEIPFPSRLPEVRDAFAAAKRRAKLRSIADGEKRASMVSRLLQKLLPLFLHHVEVDLKDVSISITLACGLHVSLRSDKIATSDAVRSRGGAQRQNAGDLSKQLQIGNVCVDVFKRCDAMADFDKADDLCRLEFMDGLWKKATVFCIPKLEISLNFDGGAVALIFELPCSVVLTLHTVLIDLLLALKKSRLRWTAAHERWCIMHDRTSRLSQPRLRPSQDPKPWFRYAAQEAVRLKRGSGLRALSDEYKSLYLRRLTGNHRLLPCENDRIAVLEEILEVRTILALREQASRDIFVDEATSLATGDLVSRWLFGSKLTDGRETIASEIRQALDSLERFSKDFGSPVANRANASEARPVGGTWTKAIVTARMQRFEIGVVHDDSKLLLSISDVKGWAEMYSSLSNFAAVLTFEDIEISNASFVLLRRARPSRVESGVLMQWEPSSCVEPPLDRDSMGVIQAKKMRLDPSFSISSSLASLCMEIDAPSLAPLLGYANHFRQSYSTSSGSRKSLATSMSVNRAPPTVSVVIDLQIAESTVLLAIPRSISDPYLSKKAFCLDLRKTVVDIDIERKVRTANVSTNLGLRAGVFQDTSRHVHAEQMNLRIVEDLEVNCSFERNNFVVDFGDLNVLLSHKNLEACTSLAAFLVEEVVIENSRRQAIESSADIRFSNSIRFLPGFPQVSLKSSSIHVHLESQNSSESSVISLKCVSGVLGDGYVRISAENALLGTSDDNNILNIHHSNANENGISVEFSVHDQASGDAKSTVSPRLLVEAGSASICSSPTDLSRILISILSYIKQFWYSVQAPLAANKDAMSPRDTEELNTLPLSTSVALESLSVEIPSEGVRLCSDVCAYSFKNGKHFGSFQTVKLLDVGGTSGHYCKAVETLRSESASAHSGKCITFSVDGQKCEVHLSDLNIVLLQPFVEKVVATVSAVVEVILGFAEEIDVVFSHVHTMCNRLPSAESENEAEELSDDADQSVVIRGHSLQLIVPVNKSSLGAIRIALPEAVVSLADGLQVINIRKAAVLTRPSTSSPQVSLASSSENPLLQEWIYLVRSLDLEFSHKEKQFESTDLSHKSRSHWSFEVLNHATVFLVPSQVMLIWTAVSQFVPMPTETNEKSDNISPTKSEPANSPHSHCEGKESDTDTVPDARPICDHLMVDIGTEVLSVELLEEGEHGSVAASIANITCGPCWFSLESIHDTSSGKSTRVSKKVLNILSVWVEDRRRGVQPGTGLILAIRPKVNVPQVLLKRSDNESSSCSIHFESLSRIENGDEKEASKLRISEPLVCFCPDLIASLSMFFSDSISVDELQGDGSTASSASIVVDGEPKHSSEPQSPVNSGQVEALKSIAKTDTSQNLPVTLKVSVSILKPTLFIPIPSTRKEFGLKLTSNGIGASLLMGKDGCVQCGSSVRSKSIEMSMPPLSWCFNNNSDALNAEAVFGDDHIFQPVDRRLSAFTDENPAQYTSAFNVGHALYDWERSTFHPVMLSTISGVSAKLSSSLGSCWGVSVGGIHADTDLKTLLNCSLLFKRAGGSPVSESQSSSPVDLSIRNISFHVRIPVVADDAELCDRNFQLRLRGGIRLRLGRDMAFISSRARLHADVLNENTAVRDQLLTPCDIKVKMDTVASRLSITVPMSVHVIISPLTVRTVTSICLLAARHMHRRRDVSSPSDSLPPEGVIKEEANSQGTEIFINVRGIVISLVEEHGAPLLRFVCRDVRSYVLWVTEELSWGHFELEVGTIVLEDVISWLIVADDQRTDESEWNFLFSSANDLDNTRAAPRPSDFPPRISGPSDPTKPLLQPGSFEHENMQMTLPFPNEDLAIEEPRGPSDQKGSFFCIYSKWQYPSQHIAVQVTVGPLDLRLNSRILPNLMEWITSLCSAVEDVWSAHAADIRFSQQSSDQYYQSSPRIGIDNFVVEPITIRIATKAPPRPVEQSAFRRLLDWLLGSDFMSGLTVETTRISFGGNFTDLSSFFGRLRVEYFNALMSRYMIAQLFMQVPALSALTRVGASTVLRQGNFSGRSSGLGRSSSRSARPQIAVGLASLVDDSSHMIAISNESTFGVKKNGVITRLQRSRGGPFRLGRNDSDLSMETVDITTVPPR